MPDRSTIAWLRVLAEKDTGALRFGLLETTPGGTPVRFAFASNESGANGSRPCAVEPLRAAIRRLLRSSDSEALVVKAGDFATGHSLAFEQDVPVYRVTGADPGDPSGWATRPIEAVPDVLDAIASNADPSIPLARTGRAVDVAFQDSRVRDMAVIPGLATIVTLPIPTPAGTGESVPPGGSDDLVARLCRILAPPMAASQAEHSLSWPVELMPFQQAGVRALVGMERLLLADDMGLGKTVQAVAALRILKARGILGRALVVAPTSVLDQWRREVAKWAPELSAIVVRGPATDRAWQWRAATDLTLASYGVLRADVARTEVGERFWQVVVADEAQRVKNRVETSRAVKALRRGRSWALTGTPVENREDELASIMEFVDHDGSRPLKHYVPGAALLARHRELQLRRRKNDVLDELPPKLVTKVEIDLQPAQRRSYDRAERDGIVHLKSLGVDVGIVHVLELITRLKQICNADPRTGASSKLDDIAARIGVLSTQGHKALVFSQYTSETSGTAAAVKHLAEFKPLMLTGRTPMPDRHALIEAFRKRPSHRAMVISLRAGGVGLNLQEASYVFHLDRWWNPAVERQAEDRAHRIGQTVKVHVVKYSCRDTIEERIDQVLTAKQALFDELVDDVSLDLSARLSRSEILGLFGL